MKFPKLTHGLLLAFFAYLLVPTASITPVAGLGEEASWHQALALALQNKFSFGQDILFNYGPLGFLDTGFLPEVVHVGARLLFDLYILCNLLFVIHYSLNKAKVKWMVALVIFLMFLPLGNIADPTFTLLFLFLFNLFHANENRRSFTLYNAVFIAALMFFIKVNISLVISVLLYASLIYLFATRRFSWRELVAVLITHLFLIYWGAYQLHVHIGEYLRSSLYIIEQFDESQARIFLEKNSFYLVVASSVTITMLALVAFFRNVKNVYQRQDYLFTFLMVFAAMYLALKQHFTILSTQSAMAYFVFLPPLFGLLWIFLRDHGHWFSRLSVSAFVIATITFQYLRFQQAPNFEAYLRGFFPKERQYFNAKYPAESARAKEPVLDLLNIAKLHSPYSYIKSLTDLNFKTILPKYNLQNRSLPASVMAKIGEKTVDILPNEVSYVFYNKLNYNPRPSIQSRQVVGSYLDQKNVEKYLSKTAPQIVLSQWKPDGLHNPIWYETYTKLAFMANYQKLTAASVPQFNSLGDIASYDTLSVYNRLAELQTNQINSLKRWKGAFGQPISFEANINLLLLKARFKPTTLGELARYFFQAPYIFAKVSYADGSSDDFRVTLPMFENGVLINKKVKSNADLDLLYQSKGARNIGVTSLLFYAKSDWTFQKEIDYELMEVAWP